MKTQDKYKYVWIKERNFDKTIKREINLWGLSEGPWWHNDLEMFSTLSGLSMIWDAMVLTVMIGQVYTPKTTCMIYVLFEV